MSKFEKVKMYYKRGLWNQTMVENAVKKEWITEDEKNEIIGGTEVTEETAEDVQETVIESE